MSEKDRQRLAPAIHYVPIDKLTLYIISEDELDALERGTPDSIYLNLAIFVSSVALSFSIALTTTEIHSIKTFCFFVIITAVGYLAAITFGLLWYLSRRSLMTVAKQIRRRRVPEGEQADTIDASSEFS
jgi:hypothetical protein